MRGRKIKSAIALLFVFFLLGVGTPTPPRLVEVSPGLVIIVWENQDADMVQVFNVSNTVCPYPTIQSGLFLGTVTTQVPEGPPYDEGCVLRPGDQLYLVRYRNTFFQGQDGPLIVPYHVYMPVVKQ